MEVILDKKKFPDWVKKLSAFDVYSPVQKDEAWVYEKADGFKGISPDYPNTAGAPKKIVLPQRETLLEFGTDDEGQPTVKEHLPGDREAVIFGVRPCDARALTLTDRVFGGPFEDQYYAKRRANAVVVGLACNTPPSTNCFCPTTGGSPHSSEGLDVLMTDLGDRYHVETLTKKGEKIVNAAKGVFGKASAGDSTEKEKVFAEADKKIERFVTKVTQVPEKLKTMFDSPFWDEKAMSCIRCGICTFLCPACHCFDICDEVTSPTPLEGRRVRSWDTCQYPDFTMHSSGHNPRSDRASRLRQRIMHKYNYFVDHHGEYQCTGCGRCVSLCPVSIDIIDILNEVPSYE